MAVEDYLDSHVAIAVAATATILSPRVRKVLRRGAVYGVTGVLMAGDALSGVARDVKAATAASGTSNSPQADTEAHPLDRPVAGEP
jgi:phage-related minor tail protein